MVERNAGVVFKDGADIRSVDAGRWPQNAGYPGFRPGVERQDGMRIDRDVAVPLRDGTTIYVDIYRADNDEAVPALIAWSPYGKHSPQRMELQPGVDVVASRNSPYTTWEAPDPLWWAQRGYAVIIPDPRGVFGSEGDASYWNHDEAEDEYDLIEWAAAQSWCIGKIGLAGVSYLAVSQWYVASHRPPHLAAIMPWEGFSDLYRDVVRHGGIPETIFLPSLQRGVEFSNNRVEDMPATAAAHPLIDDYWKGKEIDFSQIEVPAYVVASWTDQGLHTRGTLEAFKGLGSKDKWLEIHGRKKWMYFYDPASKARQLAFFDQFLKGIDTGVRDWPPVRLEVRDYFNQGLFHDEQEWPLARTRYEPLYLDAHQGLMTPLESDTGTTSYDARGAGCATFTYRFQRPTDLVGHAKLRLWIEVDAGDDADLFVSLEKIGIDGEHIDFPHFGGHNDGPVALGWLRVSHREQDEARSTPWQPWLKHERELPIKPGGIVPVDIEILPAGTHFEPGESLRLVVAGHDRRVYHSMPFMLHDELRNAGRHIIHAGGRYDSHLLLPHVDMSASDGSDRA